MATTTAPGQNRFGTAGASGPAARDAGTDTGPDPTGAGTGGKRKLLKSKKFLLAVVLVLVAAGGAYKFAVPHPAGPPKGGEVVPLEATTLNLAGGHYLKVAISVQLVAGKGSADSFSTSQAAQLTIEEFSDRTVASLSSNTARTKLLADLLTKLKAAYPGEVYDVFVTQFVTQ
jgi:flagellar FliL protein